MSVSKRTRYEVLRRDNHTCRYCGGTAPDVTLTIDHVTPVSLGGSDDPSNLVAACKDCNAGKSSSNPDAPLVAGVSDDALRWAAALREVADRRARELEQQNEMHDRLLDVWESHPSDGYYDPVLPDNWWGSVQSLTSAGLPETLIADAMRRALSARHVSFRDKFRYMCGICWRQVTAIQEEARAALSAQTPSSCAHCGVEDCGREHTADWRCLVCGEQDCLYDHGRWNGRMQGQADGARWWRYTDEPFRILSAHVDGRPGGAIESVRWVA